MNNYKLFLVVFVAVFAGVFAGPILAEAISVRSRPTIGLISGGLSASVVAAVYLIDRLQRRFRSK